MKKSILFFVFILVTVFTVYAQKSTEKASAFSIGAELGLPSGSAADAWGLGFGVSAKYALPLSADLALTASAGYISYGGKTFLGTKFPAWNTIPLKAGLKYKVGGSAFSLEPQIGYTLGSMTGLTSSEVSGFTWAFGAGYQFTQLIDLGIRYESFGGKGATTSADRFNLIGVRVGFNF